MTAIDPCFCCKIGKNRIDGLQVTQVDDTCRGGSSDFSILESDKSKIFNSKPRSSDLPMKFNGTRMESNGFKGYIMQQKDHCSNISEVDPSSIKSDDMLKKLFQSSHGKISYVVTSTRPDLSLNSAQLSRVLKDNKTESHIKLLNSTVRMPQMDNYMNIPKLDIDSIYFAGYADAGFANNEDLTFQLGFIVMLKDKHNNAAIIHHGSWKFYRVTRSVLGAEIYAFSQCLDFVIALSHDSPTIVQRKVKTVTFTDSKSLFDTITKLRTVSEKRLLIEIVSIGESYTNADLSNVAHISSKHNIVNVFTESKAEKTILCTTMKTRKHSNPISQWILPSE